jgi:hypothetical protein
MEIKKIKKFLDLPFEEGKTYSTKFQTGEKFLLKKIIKSTNNLKIIRFEGIYEFAPHLGECPLNPDRLIPDKIADGEIEVCSKCNA